MSLPCPVPVLNGWKVSHAELSQLHQARRETICTATAERALDGPRLLNPAVGERCKHVCHGRDRQGNLLISITVYLPWSGSPYVRRVRLVKRSHLNVR